MIATELTPEIEAHVRSLLLKQHRGTLDGEGRTLLVRIANEHGLSQKDLDRMEREAVERKEQETAAKQARECPQFLDDGEILSPIPVMDKFLTMDATEAKNSIVVSRILSGEVSIETLRNVRLHRHPDDSPEWFNYLCGLIRDVLDGTRTPGKLFHLLEGNGRAGRNGGLPYIFAGNTPLEFKEPVPQCFVRQKTQSDAILDKLVKQFMEGVEKQADTIAMRPPSLRPRLVRR